MPSRTFKPLQHFGEARDPAGDRRSARAAPIRFACMPRTPGIPVAGDEKYGDRERDAKLKPFGLERMFLHAHSLSFVRRDGQPFEVSAPLPAELQRCWIGWRRSEIAIGLGQRESVSPQRARQPDQRQADQRRRVLRIDTFEQRDAQRFGLEAAGAVVRLVAGRRSAGSRHRVSLRKCTVVTSR